MKKALLNCCMLVLAFSLAACKAKPTAGPTDSPGVMSTPTATARPTPEQTATLPPVSDVLEYPEVFPYFFTLDTAVSVDLNNNGQNEVVCVQQPDPQNPGLLLLRMNDQSWEVDLFDPTLETFAIIELSGRRLVVLGTMGPSNDPFSRFFTFDNGGIIDCCDTLPENGLTTVITPESSELTFSSITKNETLGVDAIRFSQRAKVLQTWFFDVTYALNGNFFFEIPPAEGLYKSDTAQISPVTLRCPLTLFQSRDITAKQITLPAQQKVTFGETDNKSWVKVTAGDGTGGWMLLPNFTTVFNGGQYQNTMEVFEGLNFAG